MPTTRRNTLLTTLMISIFLGFMLATTGGFLSLACAWSPRHCCAMAQLEERLPISNRRLNLYCDPAEREPYAVPFMPYLLVTTLVFPALAFVPLTGLLWRKGANGPRSWTPAGLAIVSCSRSSTARHRTGGASSEKAGLPLRPKQLDLHHG